MNSYEKVLAYYGHTAQLEKTSEELRELDDELWEWMDKGKNRDKVLEEMADVQNMLNQLQIIFNVSLKEMFDVQDAKMKRTLERIEMELGSQSQTETDEQRQKRLNCYIGNGVNNWRCDVDCAFWDGERCEKEGSVGND